MKLEITFNEIENYLKNNYKTDLSLKQKSPRQLLLDIPYAYIILNIKKVEEHSVLLKYGPGSIFSAAKFWIFSSKLDQIIEKAQSPLLNFDKINSEITIDLRKIEKLKELLKILSITDIYFINRSVKIMVEVI